MKLCFCLLLLLANFVFEVSCRPHNWPKWEGKVKRDSGEEVTQATRGESEIYNPFPTDTKWSDVIKELSKLNSIFTVLGTAESRLIEFWKQVEGDINFEIRRIDSLDREKRDDNNDYPLTRDTEGYWAVEQWSYSWTEVIRENWNITLGTLSMTPFTHKNMIFWIVTSTYDHTGPPGVTGIYMMTIIGDDKHVQYSQIVGTKGANKCIPILMNDHFIEIVCAESFEGDNSIKASQRGSCVIRVTWTGEVLEAEVIRSLATHNAVDVASLSDGDVIYIAYAGYYDMIRSSYETSSTVIRVKTHIYSGSWFTSYDYVDSTRMLTYGASAITSFSIYSQKFFAVANHHNDLGHTEIYSEIFTFDDIESQRIVSFQRILTKAARGIAYFSFQRNYRHEHFIAIANEYIVKDGDKLYETESIIYKFADGKFVPFQCIPTNGAWQIVSYQGENGELLIAVVNSRIENGVHLYQYDGWRFVRLFEFVLQTKIGVNQVSITKVNEEIWITICDPEDEINWKPQVYSFIFVHKNPLAEFHGHSQNWCISQKETLVQANLQLIKITIDGLPKTNEPFTFHSNVTFRKSLTVDSPDTSSVHSTIYEEQGDKVWGTRIAYGVNGTKEECDELIDTLTMLILKYDDSMKINSVELDMVTFSTVTIDADIEAVTVITNYYNTYDANWDLYISFVNVVDIDVHLRSVMIEETNNYIYTIMFLDGQSLKMKNFVYLNQDVTIIADTTFNSLITSSMAVTTLDISNFLLITGSLAITGIYTIYSFNIQQNAITVTYINDLHFNNFISILVINDGSSIVIDGDLTVKVNVKTEYFYTETIHSHVLINIVDSVFRTDIAVQTITGLHSCGWMIAGSIVIEGTLNGIYVPGGIFLQDASYDLTNINVTFVSITSTKIIIKQRLNEIQVLENNQLDILTVNYNEIVTGTKIFNELYLGGSTFVGGTVAGKLIQNIPLKSIVDNKITGRIQGNVRFKGGLTVTTGIVGDVDINRIKNFAMPLSNEAFQAYCLRTQTSCTQLVISQQLTFIQQVQVTGDFECNMLNLVSIENYATITGDHTFSTELTFYKNMMSLSNINVHLVNGIDLHLLIPSLWLQSTGGTLLYDITFNYLSVQSVVTTTCTFGTFDITDLVLLHQDVMISDDWTFNTLIWAGTELTVVSFILPVHGTLDTVLFLDLLLETLKKNILSIQMMNGTNIKIQKLVTMNLNGLGLDELSDKVIYVDQDLHFHHNVEITSQVYIQELYFTVFDGVSSNVYDFGWLLNDGSCQNLTGHNVFAGSLNVENLEISEVDFTFLNLTKTEIEISLTSVVNVFGAIKYAIRIDRDVSIGSTMVWNNIESEANIEASYVQGIDLSEQSIYIDELTTITVVGRKTFEKEVHFTGDFWLDDHMIINDASIFHGGICEEFNHPLNLHSLDIYGDVYIHNLAKIIDTFNDYTTTTLLNAYWQVDRNVTINSEVSMNIGIFGVINLDGIMLNGLIQAEIEDLLLKRIRVFSDVSQTITGLFSFSEFTVNYLYVFELTTSNQIIDLVNIFRRDVYQEISGSWKVKIINNIDSVNYNFWLLGGLNGISLVNLVRHNYWSLITAQKYFSFDVTVNVNLNVEVFYLVQGVDISLWAELAMYIDQDYESLYGVTFATTTHFHYALIVMGLVDNVVISSTMIFIKSEDQTLNLESMIYEEFEMRNTINTVDEKVFGVNLNRLSVSAVFIDKEVTIDETTIFEESLTLGDITLDMFNGINITMLGDFLTSDHKRKMTDVLIYLNGMCNSITDTLNDNELTDIWYWQTESEFKTNGEDIFLYPVCVQRDSYLLPGNRFINPSILMLEGFKSLKLLDWNVLSMNYEPYFEYNFSYTSGAAGLGNNFIAVCSYREPTAALHEDISMKRYKRTSVILDAYTDRSDKSFGHIYNIADGEPRVVSSYPVNGCVEILVFKFNNRTCMAPINFRSDIVTIICHNQGIDTFEYLTTLQINQAFQAKWITSSRFTYIFVGSMAVNDKGISTLNIFKLNENGENTLENKIEMKVMQFEFSVLQLESYSHDLLVVLQKSSKVANAFVRICHVTYNDDGNINVFEVPHLHHKLISSAARLSLTFTYDLRPLIVVETSSLIVSFKGTPMGTDFKLHSKIHLGNGKSTNMEAFMDEARRKIHIVSGFEGSNQYEYYSFSDQQSSSYIYSSVYRPDFGLEEDIDKLKLSYL